MAVTQANSLNVPLIVTGDMHDTKANLRGECIDSMIRIFRDCAQVPYIIVGNHDRINEKSSAHSLEFLRPYANIVDSPLYCKDIDFWLLPYYHDRDECAEDLARLPEVNGCKRFIMHQGIEESHSGDYIQDKSAITKQDAAGLTVWSGHYHRRQSIKLPDGGTWNYVGNPFTLGFGEANDPVKGFQVLNSDGTAEFIPTNLRKHVVIEQSYGLMFSDTLDIRIIPGDLVWVKLSGHKENLAKTSRDEIAFEMGLTGGFRLDLIPTDGIAQKVETKGLSQTELLDTLITSMPDTSDERKNRLKQLWRQFCE